MSKTVKVTIECDIEIAKIIWAMSDKKDEHVQS